MYTLRVSALAPRVVYITRRRGVADECRAWSVLWLVSSRPWLRGSSLLYVSHYYYRVRSSTRATQNPGALLLDGYFPN